MDKKEITQQLKQSLDVSSIRAWAVLYNIIVLFAVLMVGLSRGFARNEFWPVITTTLVIMLLPANLFFLIRVFNIYRCPEYYKFYKTELTQPRGGRMRDTIRFRVLLEDAEGRFVVDTHSIFLTHGFPGPLLEDYVNQTVTIAYNDLTEEVVVIG